MIVLGPPVYPLLQVYIAVSLKLVVVNETITLLPAGGGPQLTMLQLSDAPPGVQAATPPVTAQVRLATPEAVM